MKKVILYPVLLLGFAVIAVVSFSILQLVSGVALLLIALFAAIPWRWVEKIEVFAQKYLGLPHL